MVACDAPNNQAMTNAVAIAAALPERTGGISLLDDYDELPPPQIVVWDIQPMQRRVTFTGHHGQINTLAFSTDGKVLASGGSDGTVRLWSLPKGASSPK